MTRETAPQDAPEKTEETGPVTSAHPNSEMRAAYLRALACQPAPSREAAASL